MKKVGMLLGVLLLVGGILYTDATLNSTQIEPRGTVHSTRSESVGIPLILTTRLASNKSYWHMAMATLSELGVPVDGGKSMALTAILLAVVL